MLRDIQVNIPFTMLRESYLPFFLDQGLNPEIGFDAHALDAFSPWDFSRVARELQAGDLNITLHGPFMDLAPGSADPGVRSLTRQRFEQTLRLVPVFRPKTVVFHGGYDPKRYASMKELWMENSLEIWSWLAARVRTEGSLLMLENVFEQGPEDMRALFEPLREQAVGFCLDTGHQSAFSRVSLSEWFTSLEPYLGQLHLHDNLGEQDEHLALGEGNIDFRMFFEQLRTKRKDPPLITLEPHREEDFLKSLTYLEGIWPW